MHNCGARRLMWLGEQEKWIVSLRHIVAKEFGEKG